GKFESALRSLSGRGKISESNVRDAMEQVREALLEADVHYEVVESFVEEVTQRAVGTEVLQAVHPGEQMIKIVHDELVRLFGGDPDNQDDPAEADPVLFVDPGPTIIMMCGLQGSGKTTTCGKLAGWLKKRGKRVVLAAADLQRPAAVTQLRVVAEQAQAELSQSPDGKGEVTFYGEPDKVAEYGKAVGVAVDVCKRAVEHGRATGADVVILDTAGRLHINDELMGELRRVNTSLQPHQVYLVIDAMTGQDAINSARAFHEQLEIDGLILTKFDSDTRGGAALTAKRVVGEPVKFIGTGEKLDALDAFHPRRMAGRILGMGDVVSLVERAQEQVSEEEAMALQEKMAAGKLTMEDFLSQLRKLRRMGNMKQLLGMLPGVGAALKDLPLDDKEIDRTEAIIQSMTPAERRDVDLLNNSRRRRVAAGSGQDAQQVSQLVKGFEMVAQMSKQMTGAGMMGRMKSMAGMGGVPAMPGMPGMPGRKGSTKASQQKSGFKQRKRKRR
ncbi:MAG: signal recognition particle protein, partial [Planctomycetota bacterium]